MRTSRIKLILFITTLFLAPQIRAEDEVDVGRSAAGKLKAEIGFAPPLELPVSVFPGFSGYATGEVGIHSIIFDQPESDLFQLSPAANFQFTLVAKDPGIELWDGSAFMSVGATYFIGPAPFDTHPIFNIVSGSPGNTYSLTLKLHDTTATYQDSDPFVLSFTPVPEPTTATVCAIALIALSLRRGSAAKPG